jgi:hypothetical protein
VAHLSLPDLVASTPFADQRRWADGIPANGPALEQLYLSIEGARNSDSGCTSCSHVTESIVLFFFPNWHRLLLYVPFFCSSCKLHPIISELQPSYFVALKDGGLCFLDAVFDFIEESV